MRTFKNKKGEIMKKTLLMFSLLWGGLAFSYPISPMMTLDRAGNIVEYMPTEISTSKMERIFSRMRKEDKSNSICGDRAQVWATDLKQQYGIESKKIWIHYTEVFNHVVNNSGKHPPTTLRRWGFLRRVAKKDIEWWYHVAPVVVADGQDYVLDRKFTDRPYTIDEWEERFGGNAERFLNVRSNRSETIQNLRENMAKYRGSDRADKRRRYRLNKAALDMIQQAYNPSTRRYEVRCKKIEHVIDHDREEFNEWCHLQMSTSNYWSPAELRMLNYNSRDELPNMYSGYTESRKRAGARNIRTYVYRDNIEASYKDAYGLDLKEIYPRLYPYEY